MKTCKVSILVAPIFVLPFIATADYNSKSVFSDDYKCMSNVSGGFNHGSSGHELALFKDTDEFFLTHITSIPEKAISDIKDVFGYPDDDINGTRETLESVLMKQEYITDTIVNEKSSYFIRQPDEDPSKYYSYVHGGCSAFRDVSLEGKSNQNENSSINCYESSSDKVFIFDLETMRFAYSYIGTWHRDNTGDNYHGDSSVFSFGSCEKYFR